jgi:acyl carrier protein
MKTIEEEFMQIFMFMGIPKEKIKIESSLVEDFDFDECQLICLALYINIFFKVNIKESDYNELITVGDTIDLVKKKINN